MNAKLTLSLDKEVIEKAKAYAKEQGISLSKMLENYLKVITKKSEKDTGEIEISPFVKSLAVPGLKPRTKEQMRKEYREYLEKKYR
jgi:hypothetical protein